MRSSLVGGAWFWNYSEHGTGWSGYWFVVGSHLSAQLNWHYAFILTGAPGILLAIAFMFSREPQRGQSEEDKRVYAVPR